jgi:hypothetical protein
MISAIRRVTDSTSRAWMSMSLGAPRKPAEPWWIIIFAFGRAERLPGRAAREDHRGGRHRHPDADRLHVGFDELNRVVDRHPRVRGASGRVDVEADVLVRILGLEEEELRRDQVRDVVVDLGAEERRSARATGASRCRRNARSGQSDSTTMGTSVLIVTSC